MADPVEFIVTLAPGTKASAVADALGAKGFKSSRVLESLSMIVGTADPDVAASFRSIEGVSAVEPSVPIQLSPGDPQ